MLCHFFDLSQHCQNRSVWRKWLIYFNLQPKLLCFHTYSLSSLHRYQCVLRNLHDISVFQEIYLVDRVSLTFWYITSTHRKCLVIDIHQIFPLYSVQVINYIISLRHPFVFQAEATLNASHLVLPLFPHWYRKVMHVKACTLSIDWQLAVLQEDNVCSNLTHFDLLITSINS